MNTIKDKFKRFLRSPWIYLVIFALVLGLTSLFARPGMRVEEIPYSQFLTMVNDDEVKSVEIIGDRLEITPKADLKDGIPTYYTSRVVENDALAMTLYTAGVEFSETEPSEPVSILDLIMTGFSLMMMLMMTR